MGRGADVRPAAVVIVAVALLIVCMTTAVTRGDETSSAPVDEAAAKRTAVALNYCRSSFYRIHRNPGKDVLSEERRKILNNLNLTSIQDEEVVTLYSSVLDEIGSIHIADREKKVVDAGFGRSWQSLASFTAFGLLTDATELNYASMVKRGATSWWDYRGMQVNHDMELWKVEKSRMTAIQTKSSSFLDASWKLARKRNLPDRWLLRDAELERLETAMQEPDPEVRLRLLARMEPFMECYPPYWYYLGRTQQRLGKFIDAERTYARLADVGDGYFRRDEMLAASSANLASIRDFLKMAGAKDAAEKALSYTTDSWEVNLTAAMVLMRHGNITLAEDAVLRNLDANLEADQSKVALLAVYARQGDPVKILARLDDAATVARTPVPVLLRCAAALKGQTLPRPAADRLQSSLHGYFGRDDFVLVADPAWEFRSAQFAVDETTFARPTLHATDRAVTVQFRRAANAISPGSLGDDEFAVLLKYADDFEVKLTLRRDAAPEVTPTATMSRLGHFLSFASDRDREPAPARDVLRVTSVETTGALIGFNGPVRAIASATVPPKEHEVATTNPSAGLADGFQTTLSVSEVSALSIETAAGSQTIKLGSPQPIAEVSP
ncbi:MAG: hypothetical protein M3552_21865 [Planctomycetota bacterium]|nr:hypothetical protein [Planctomycetaceae bacterium]MDQ3333259.1 hypothetical protein [Planctomycetota bacterium]